MLKSPQSLQTISAITDPMTMHPDRRLGGAFGGIPENGSIRQYEHQALLNDQINPNQPRSLLSFQNNETSGLSHKIESFCLSRIK